MTPSPTAQHPARGTRTTVLDARYGRTPEHRRRTLVVAVAAAVVAGALVVAWGVWTGVGGSASSLQVSTSAVVLRGSAVEVGWEVDGRARDALVCTIEAQAKDETVVGLKEVAVPVTGSAVRTGTTTVRVVRAATSGLIQSCRDA